MNAKITELNTYLERQVNLNNNLNKDINKLQEISNQNILNKDKIIHELELTININENIISNNNIELGELNLYKSNQERTINNLKLINEDWEKRLSMYAQDYDNKIIDKTNYIEGLITKIDELNLLLSKSENTINYIKTEINQKDGHINILNNKISDIEKHLYEQKLN